MERRRRIAPQRGQRPPGPRVDLDDVIYGIHAVNEALVAGEPLRRIHVGDERKSDPALRNLLERARAAEVQVRFENRTFFGNFPYKAHQSVVAYGAPFDYITLEEAIALPRPGPALFVVLDHVTDPHNVGAIIRTTEAAGEYGARAARNGRSKPASTRRKCARHAAGATAHLPIARVANISAGDPDASKKAGIWVAGAALERGRPCRWARPILPAIWRS